MHGNLTFADATVEMLERASAASQPQHISMLRSDALRRAALTVGHTCLESTLIGVMCSSWHSVGVSCLVSFCVVPAHLDSQASVAIHWLQQWICSKMLLQSLQSICDS